MTKPIRCIECYKKRLGGRCEFCPLHRQNKGKYTSIGKGWYTEIKEKKLDKFTNF